MGAVMGVGMGLFMGAMGDVSPIQIIQGQPTCNYDAIDMGDYGYDY